LGRHASSGINLGRWREMQCWFPLWILEYFGRPGSACRALGWVDNRIDYSEYLDTTSEPV